MNLWWRVVKAYIITSEEADTVVEVANAMPMRNVKEIPINIPCLFILTNSLDMIDVHILNLAKLYIKEKNEKYL